MPQENKKKHEAITPEAKAQRIARATQSAEECYQMSERDAFLQRLLGSTHYDYSTPEGVRHIKEECFDDTVARPLHNMGLKREEIETIRTKARGASKA